MPGVYREKVCPTCGKKHRKKGKFCSKACSNSGRDEVVRAKLSVHAIDRGAIYHARIATEQAVEPPDPKAWDWDPLGKNQFISGGDIWTIVDE